MIKTGISLSKVITKGLKSTDKIVGWKSLTNTEVAIQELQGLVDVPEQAAKVIKFSGQKKNGLNVDIYIFKDKYGKNLGSQRFSSDNTIRTINISRTKAAEGDAPELRKLHDLFYDSKAKKYSVQTVDANGNILEDSHTFSEVFKMDDSFKPLSPVRFKKLTGYDKPEAFDKIYHSVARVKKTASSDGAFDVSQEVLQLKNTDTPSKSFLRMDTTMQRDGEMIIKNVESSPDINIDTTNPYFKSILLKKEDMLRSAYQEIVKEHCIKGVEPPLLFNTNSDVFESKLYKFQAAGLAPRDNSYCGLNLLKDTFRSRLVFGLGHECEHLFTQHADVYRAGLRNLKSDNPVSIKYYDYIMQKFGKIKPDTDEYKKAEKYLEDMTGYNSKVFDEKGVLNQKGHSSLIVEQEADIAGEIEFKKFNACQNYFVANFPLFNTNWLLRP